MTIKYSNVDLGQIEAVLNKIGGEAAIPRLLSGELVVVEREPKQEPVLDTRVQLDRAQRLVYPDWMKKVMHPELETMGPSIYDLATVQLWLHDGQKGGNWAKGQTIYDHLKSNNMLEGCLGLADGLAIQQKGIEVFRKFFAGKAVFLWKSVVQDRDGDLHVPYLLERVGVVVVNWDWLAHDWYDDNPAARFAS